jgi:hypothetical protein
VKERMEKCGEKNVIYLDLISVPHAAKLLKVHKGILYWILANSDYERFLVDSKLFISKDTLQTIKERLEARRRRRQRLKLRRRHEEKIKLSEETRLA